MKLKIRNFRGIESAEIDVGSISLIAGANAAGKTSVAQAFGILLTGEPIPIPGMKIKDALVYCAKVGLDAIELPAGGYPGDPWRLSGIHKDKKK